MLPSVASSSFVAKSQRFPLRKDAPRSTAARCSSLSASFLMHWIGRRAGFLIGACIGVTGSAVAAAGLHAQSFALFVLGHLLIGAWQGFSNDYRLAAAEVAGP